MEKIIRIILNVLPVLVMIALIPLVKNDYLLVLIYAVFIWAVFSVRKMNNRTASGYGIRRTIAVPAVIHPDRGRGLSNPTAFIPSASGEVSSGDLIKKNDVKVFILGLCAMTVFETIFIGTGVETFNRNTLFGIMPIWLPLLWAYGFVAIKRTLEIIDE